MRRAKDQERAQEAENEKRASGVFRNLNTDQELLSLSEAQLKAKEGKLDRHDSIVLAGKAVSQTDFDHILASVVRHASPEHDSSTPPSSMNGLQASGPPAVPPKNVTRSAVFTRTPVQTQDSRDANPSAAASHATEIANPDFSAEASSSAPATAAVAPVAKNAAATPSAKATVAASPSNPAPSTAFPKPAGPKPIPAKKASNVEKMTAFWSNPAK